MTLTADQARVLINIKRAPKHNMNLSSSANSTTTQELIELKLVSAVQLKSGRHRVEITDLGLEVLAQLNWNK